MLVKVRSVGRGMTSPGTAVVRADRDALRSTIDHGMVTDGARNMYAGAKLPGPPRRSHVWP